MKLRWIEIAEYAKTYGTVNTARKFDISRERVRQIINLSKGKTPFTGTPKKGNTHVEMGGK